MNSITINNETLELSENDLELLAELLSDNVYNGWEDLEKFSDWIHSKLYDHRDSDGYN